MTTTYDTENQLLPESQLITTLKEILAKSEYSHIMRPYFAGGTLCLDYKRENGLESVCLLNFGDERLTREVKYLMAKIYVEYKTESHHFYAQARRLVEEWESDHPEVDPEQFRPY